METGAVRRLNVPSWLLNPTAHPELPTRVDAKRPTDRIRARILCDRRITGNLFAIAIAISEHVTGPTYAAKLKRETVMRWSHVGDVTRVSNGTRALEALGVLFADRKRTFMRYVFASEWIAQWEPFAVRGKTAPGKLRSAENALHEVRKTHFTGDHPQGGGRRAERRTPAARRFRPTSRRSRRGLMVDSAGRYP